ncbi:MULTISPECIES: hypothetical protein [Bacillaceae]|nr:MULTISPECIES: hypothetical protein [Bacillaceae]UGB31689.1 hypothetical protein LPC09_04195 [Metabacillus sp. B2-18]
MIVMFQILLMAVILITALGAVAEKDKEARTNLTSIVFASIAACLITFAI